MNATTAEPLAIRGAVVAALVAVLHVAVVLGLQLTAEQEAAIAAAIGVIGTAVVVIWSRGHVTPNAHVAAWQNPAGDVVSGPADEWHRNGEQVALVHPSAAAVRERTAPTTLCHAEAEPLTREDC